MSTLSGRGGVVRRPWAIDRDALHRYLYRKSGHRHAIRLDVNKLAADLDLGYCNLTSVVKAMAEEGRLRRISGRPQAVKTYVVVDPAVWEEG